MAISGLILSAGKGERLKHKTLITPKPLIKVEGDYLIEHPINWLLKNNVKEIVINLWYKKEKFFPVLHELEKKYRIKFTLSLEEELMGTGGGIIKAAHLVSSDLLIVHNSDIICDVNGMDMLSMFTEEKLDMLLLCVPWVEGTTTLFYRNGKLSLHSGEGERLTYGGVSIINRKFLMDLPLTRGSFLDLILIPFLKNHRVSAFIHTGLWCDGGTEEGLENYKMIKNLMQKAEQTRGMR